MEYEVENKFAVDDFTEIADGLAELGAAFEEPVEQVDMYFAHPLRDFARTDEALRIRRMGDTNLITYKGPKIDGATKTRVEIELPLGPGADRTRQYAQLLTVLGFEPRREVQKRRVCGRFQWQGWSVSVALDDVRQLGKYVELELNARLEQLDGARAVLLELASHLGLPGPERRSYLELLLEADGCRK
jgi:adenylate cyclase class 2